MQDTVEHAIVQYLGGVHACFEEKKPSQDREHNYSDNENSIDVHTLICGETSGFSLVSQLFLLCPEVREVVGAATHHLREHHDEHHEGETEVGAARMKIFIPHPG